MNAIVENILMHYGVARRSGRYPWGSGENPYQHSGDFLSRVQELKNSGLSETDIAKSMGLTTTQLRTQMSLAKDERRSLQVATAKDLRAKGYSLNDIAKQMGFSNDSELVWKENLGFPKRNLTRRFIFLKWRAILFMELEFRKSLTPENRQT